MSDIKSSSAVFFKLKFCRKNKLTFEKSNKYASYIINDPNITLEDLIRFSNLVSFDKEIFFEKLLEKNNADLIIGYLNFLIFSGDKNFIYLKNFNKLFEIYLENCDLDITNFILDNLSYMNSNLLILIFNHYFKDNKIIINKILHNQTVLSRLIDFIDNQKLEYIKRYVFTLVKNYEYNTAEFILNILESKKIVDLEYIKKFENSIVDNRNKDDSSVKFIIKYYKNNIDNEQFINRGYQLLSSVIKSANNGDIYSLVKFLLGIGDLNSAIHFSKFVKISESEREICNYSRLLKLSIPIATIIERDKYLDKKSILNIIKKDKLKLFVYGQEIINGYNFDDHKKNGFLDNKYVELLEGINIDNSIKDEEIDKEFNRISSVMIKINRYNTFFQKNS